MMEQTKEQVGGEAQGMEAQGQEAQAQAQAGAICMAGGALGLKGRGRKRKVTASSKWDTSFVAIAARLTAAGFRIEDLGYALGVGGSTISNWKSRYPAFRRALEEGKEVAKQHLIASAFRVATGFEYTKTEVKFNAKGRVCGRRVMTDYMKPDGNVLQFLLCNLDPSNWRQRRQVDQRQTLAVVTGRTEASQIRAFAGRLLGLTEAEGRDEQSSNEDTRQSRYVPSRDTGPGGGESGVSDEVTAAVGPG